MTQKVQQSPPYCTYQSSSIVGLHRNPEVYPNPLKFDPDRWSPAEEAKRSPYAWVPFSYGKRGCIGHPPPPRRRPCVGPSARDAQPSSHRQQLSLLEQRVTLAHLVRKFHMRVDPKTDIKVATPLFPDPQGAPPPPSPQKPMTCARRVGDASTLCPRCASGVLLNFVPRAAGIERPMATPAAALTKPSAGSSLGGVGAVEELASAKLLVLFGSNMGIHRVGEAVVTCGNLGSSRLTSAIGTSEDLADRMVDCGAGLGMAAEKHPLDDVAKGKVELPKAGAGLVIVVTSVYNGRPPENAIKFDEWLETPAAEAALAGVRYGVFGCGNKQWAATFMKFPARVHERFEALGVCHSSYARQSRLLTRGYLRTGARRAATGADGRGGHGWRRGGVQLHALAGLGGGVAAAGVRRADPRRDQGFHVTSAAAVEGRLSRTRA